MNHCIIIILLLQGQFSVESADDMMKMVMSSSFNFSWNLSSDVSARCSSHPQGEMMTRASSRNVRR